MNNNYYQSDIRTSRQEDILLSIDDDRQCLLGLIKYWREECFKQDKQLKAYENMRKEAIKELSKDYKNLPDIDEWYATDKQWHNYYFEKSEQDDYKIENTLNILNKVGGNDEN